MKNNFSKMFLSALLLVSQAVYAQQSDSVSTSTTTVAPSASIEAKPPIVHSSNFEESSPKVLGVSFFSLGGINADQFKRDDPSFYVYEGYLSFNYKVNSNVRFAARPAFNYSTEGLDYQGNSVTNKMTTRDFSLLATRYNLFEDELPANVEFKTQVRMYLPTSEGSKAEGMIARLRFEFEGKYFFSKYSNVRAYWKPNYYFQRTTAYLDSAGKIKTTNLGESQHGAEVDVNLNKYFSVKPGFEFEDTWLNESQVNNRDPRHYNTIAYRMGLEVRPMRIMNFTVGYQDRRDLVQTDRYPDVSYSLMTNVRIY